MALSSSFILQSTASTLSSLVLNSGLISSMLQSRPMYALYRLVTNLTMFLKAVPVKPRLKAIFLA